MSFYRNDLSKLKTMLTDIVNNDNANKDDFNNGYFMVNVNLSFPSDERASSNNDELYTCFRNLIIFIHMISIFKININILFIYQMCYITIQN